MAHPVIFGVATLPVIVGEEVALKHIETNLRAAYADAVKLRGDELKDIDLSEDSPKLLNAINACKQRFYENVEKAKQKYPNRTSDEPHLLSTDYKVTITKTEKDFDIQFSVLTVVFMV